MKREEKEEGIRGEVNKGKDERVRREGEKDQERRECKNVKKYIFFHGFIYINRYKRRRTEGERRDGETFDL